jgi:hypothetical protein
MAGRGHSLPHHVTRRHRRHRTPLLQLTSEAEMNTLLQSEPIEKGLSRRGLVQALAAGAAAASVATPALAQQMDYLQEEAYDRVYDHFVKFFAG